MNKIRNKQVSENDSKRMADVIASSMPGFTAALQRVCADTVKHHNAFDKHWADKKVSINAPVRRSHGVI